MSNFHGDLTNPDEYLSARVPVTELKKGDVFDNFGSGSGWVAVGDAMTDDREGATLSVRHFPDGGLSMRAWNDEMEIEILRPV